MQLPHISRPHGAFKERDGRLGQSFYFDCRAVKAFRQSIRQTLLEAAGSDMSAMSARAVSIAVREVVGPLANPDRDRRRWGAWRIRDLHVWVAASRDHEPVRSCTARCAARVCDQATRGRTEECALSQRHLRQLSGVSRSGVHAGRRSRRPVFRCSDPVVGRHVRSGRDPITGRPSPRSS
jgi:hypothetical protein